MSRDAIARACVLVCLCTSGLSTAACDVKPAPLGSLDTSTTGEPSESDSSDGGSSGGTTGASPDGPAPAGPPEIDILFVMDNSGSMGEEQAALVSTIDNLVGALEGVSGISYRIGVTTTDAGNPWCASTSPESGELVATSCRSRTGQFIFNGDPPVDVTDIACTDLCDYDDIVLAETAVAGEATLRARPWIEGGNGTTNVLNASVGEALRCMLPQGIAGCGFEQPLEAARQAVVRAQTPGDPSYGFIRDTAHLVVIYVSDEMDCSFRPGEQWIFMPEDMGGEPSRFWSDPDAFAPTSAVCWNAGVVCEGSIAGEDGEQYETCRAANYSRTEVDVSDEEAVLQPVSRYVDVFTDLLQRKRAVADASVFLYGVLAVPSGYPANPLEFAPSADPVYQMNFGIGPGCGDGETTAVPPVRQLAVIEAFGYENLVGSQVFSICDPALGAVYNQIMAQLAPYLGG